MQDVHFLHIRGELYENMVYHPRSCFESTTAKRYTGDENYQVVLMNEEGTDILEVHPFIASYCVPAEETEKFQVRACLPLHPRGSSFELRRGTLVIYRCEIPATPPEIEIISAKLSKNKIAFKWKSDRNDNISFNIVARMDSDRSITIAKRLSANNYTVDLTKIEASGKGQIFIIAHDGVRSAEAGSKTFKLPKQPPVIHIISPAEHSILTYGQPVSVVVSCYDIDGNEVPSSSLRCLLDNNIVSEGKAIVVLPNVAPGKHLLEFNYEGELGKSVSKLKFKVSQPDDSYKEWLSFVEKTIAEHNV